MTMIYARKNDELVMIGISKDLTEEKEQEILQTLYSGYNVSKKVSELCDYFEIVNTSGDVWKYHDELAAHIDFSIFANAEELYGVIGSKRVIVWKGRTWELI